MGNGVFFQWADFVLWRKEVVGVSGGQGKVVHTEEIVSDSSTKQDRWAPTEPLGVDYTEIILVTVIAIQEQQQIIEAKKQ